MRAQSHVVGVALMLGVAVLALGTLTAGVGTLVDAQTATADTQRVADGFDRALAGAEQTGTASYDITFSEGTIRTANRTLRILSNETVVETVDVGAVVYDHDGGRVVALAGAVVRDGGGSAVLADPPSVAHSTPNAVLAVGAPAIGTDRRSISGGSGVTATVRTNVSHDRRALGTANFSVAIETTTPAPFRRHFTAQGARVTTRSFAGDEHTSVVAAYPGLRQGYLVVHDLNLEVSNG
jgi:hypothetical protein